MYVLIHIEKNAALLSGNGKFGDCLYELDVQEFDAAQRALMVQLPAVEFDDPVVKHCLNGMIIEQAHDHVCASGVIDLRPYTKGEFRLLTLNGVRDKSKVMGSVVEVLQAVMVRNEKRVRMIEDWFHESGQEMLRHAYEDGMIAPAVVIRRITDHLFHALDKEFEERYGGASELRVLRDIHIGNPQEVHHLYFVKEKYGEDFEEYYQRVRILRTLIEKHLVEAEYMLGRCAAVGHALYGRFLMVVRLRGKDEEFLRFYSI